MSAPGSAGRLTPNVTAFTACPSQVTCRVAGVGSPPAVFTVILTPPMRGETVSTSPFGGLRRTAVRKAGGLSWRDALAHDAPRRLLRLDEFCAWRPRGPRQAEEQRGRVHEGCGAAKVVLGGLVVLRVESLPAILPQLTGGGPIDVGLGRNAGGAQ